MIKYYEINNSSTAEKISKKIRLNTVKSMDSEYVKEIMQDVEKNKEPNNGKEFISNNVSGLYGSPLLVDNPSYLIKIIRFSQKLLNSRVLYFCWS